MFARIERHFHVIDSAIAAWMAEYALKVVRIGLGMVFFWFGVLKLVPGLSPEEDLIRSTLPFLNLAWLMPCLGAWEITIGLALIGGVWLRFVLLLIFLQMPGTALPLIFLPDITWNHFPYALTLEGQYIVKNLVLIGAALALGATVRGGGLESKPTGDSAGEAALAGESKTEQT